MLGLFLEASSSWLAPDGGVPYVAQERVKSSRAAVALGWVTARLKRLGLR